MERPSRYLELGAADPSLAEAQPKPIRVMLADDHVIWRSGLRNVLEPEFKVVAEVSEGHEAVDRAVAIKPDVVLMDINMPGMDGIAATRQIRKLSPTVSVVVVSAADNDDEIYRAIDAGVSGYVPKHGQPGEMVAAVRHAAAGEAYLPPRIAKRILEGVAAGRTESTEAVKREPPLSPREVCVLQLIGEGYRHKEIARALSISERTVGNHVTSIYNKLGIDDRSRAVIHAIKLGLVQI